MVSHPNTLPNLYPYRAVSKISEGGTGCVYLAEEPGRPDHVALKVLHPEFVGQRALVNDFLQVAKQVGTLGHTNLVKVFNTGFLNTGEPFVAMEYLKGRDLGELLAQVGSLNYGQVIPIIRQVCAGLAAAHGHGFLHLDIKPNNIFIIDTSKEYIVKVLDFGSAKLPLSHKPPVPGIRQEQLVFGTPEYWSPEQACGQSVDRRSDVYSLGVVIYEALSGRTPFWSHSVSDVIAQHVRCEPAGLVQQPNTSAIPESLIQLVLRCLKKDPDKRFQTMEELSDHLSTIPMDNGDIKKITIRACPTCNARYPDNKSYCSNDGTRLTDANDVADQGDNDPSREIGSVLGSYRLLKLLGEGGMGQVYLAEHVRLGRKVALKMLRSEYATSRDAVARFFREARAVNRINHENIVEITDFVEDDGKHNYYIMELLEGRNLGDLMRGEGRLPASRALGIAVQICKALSAAHQAGVIHRDLKSENIFLIERGGQVDFVKLLDFGVAKLTDFGAGQSVQKTGAGIIIGTPEYMSPEQASGLEVDHRSDIYSLGVILFEMVTGVNPFSVNAKSFGEVLVRHLTLKPPRPADVTDAPIRLPKQFEVLIQTCLEKEPHNRPQSIAEVEEQLRQIADKESLQLESYVSAALTKRKYRGKAISIGVAAMVLIGGVFGFTLWSSPKKQVLRPAATSPMNRPPSPGTEMAVGGFAGASVADTSGSSVEQNKRSQVSGDPTLQPATLSDNRIPPIGPPDSASGGDASAQPPALPETDTGLLANATQPEPTRKKATGVQTKRKHRSSNPSAAKSKPLPSRLNNRATVDPFAEE